MGYDNGNGMGPGPFYDNTPLPEWVPRPDPFHDKLIADTVQDILNPRVSQQAVDRIEAIYMAKIQRLQNELAQAVKERDQQVMKKNVFMDLALEIAEENGVPKDVVKTRYKEGLQRESKAQGIPLD